MNGNELGVVAGRYSFEAPPRSATVGIFAPNYFGSGWSYRFKLSGKIRLSLNAFPEANEGRMSHTKIFFTEWVSMIAVATTGFAAETHSVIDPLL